MAEKNISLGAFHIIQLPRTSYWNKFMIHGKRRKSFEK